MTEQELKELQARNQERAQQMIQKMGTKYLCHPDNQITKRKFRQELKRSKKLALNV